MKTFFVVAFAICVIYLATDTVVGLAREFEHGINDSKVESPIEPEQPPTVYHKMKATAYCINGTTATGTRTRIGVAASKREWFGKRCRIYWNDGGQPGALIGEYIIEDTGGENIRAGRVIDIWMPTEDECFAFGRQSVLVQIID